MLLAVDIGNTSVKMAVFEADALLERFVSDKKTVLPAFLQIFQKYPGVAHTILTSVGKEDDNLLVFLKSKTQVTQVNHRTKFPFINNYATPHTLGTDRMVLAAGAVLSHPAQNRLVIDAGTCITYDFVDADNAYAGGAISPGIRLRYESMHNFTAKLPLLYAEVPQGYIGNTTAGSMHSGVINGVVFEIEGFVKEYAQQYQQVTVILTGGDAEFLAKRLKSTIFANSNFLLQSLNLLYLYTNQK
ncbi:type III pantothenate kinase [Flavobacterium rhizosphaerae]|uniref:Type III pantothenate kinase n=1 Tax=Flavobacterium rhizosphaerae TaxID=3163298 RepID=A0ABW8YS22_9FLAO